MTSAPLLEVEDLALSLATGSRRLDLLDGVALAVAAGRTLAIVGESGSGKSLTLSSILGLLPRRMVVRRGSIRLSGQELVGLPDAVRREVRRTSIGSVFQDPMTALNPVVRIGAQLDEVVRCRTGATRGGAREHTLALLARVGIDEVERRARQYPHELSGGMRQRVTIARALAGGPQLLLADEPTTALDVTVQAQVIDLVLDVQRAAGTAVVWVTHDLGVVARVSDDVAVMYAGSIVEQGPAIAVFETPHHPYTAALLRSLPERGDAGVALPTIPGRPPRPDEREPGCAFAPRCQFAGPECGERPPDVTVGVARVACWRPLDTAVAGRGTP